MDILFRYLECRNKVELAYKKFLEANGWYLDINPSKEYDEYQSALKYLNLVVRKMLMVLVVSDVVKSQLCINVQLFRVIWYWWARFSAFRQIRPPIKSLSVL